MISVVILTKNAEATLRAVLTTLAPLQEIVVVDTGSTDRTKQIATSFPNVQFYEHYFIGFGPLHNQGALLASHDWILSLDSDEVPTQALIKEILSLNSL